MKKSDLLGLPIEEALQKAQVKGYKPALFDDGSYSSLKKILSPKNDKQIYLFSDQKRKIVNVIFFTSPNGESTETDDKEPAN